MASIAALASTPVTTALMLEDFHHGVTGPTEIVAVFPTRAGVDRLLETSHSARCVWRGPPDEVLALAGYGTSRLTWSG